MLIIQLMGLELIGEFLLMELEIMGLQEENKNFYFGVCWSE